nr:hypothetical protein [Burkholderiaceae bacterium]
MKRDAPMRPMHQPSVQRWLQDHCESSGLVSGGLVILTGSGPDEAQTIAEWPASGRMTPPLAAAAEAAAQRTRPVVVTPTVATPDSNHNRVIALPLRGADRTLGAVALAVHATDGQAVDALFKELELASADIGDSLRLPTWDTASDDAAHMLQLQDTLVRHPTLAAGALALVTDLAPMLGCERVSVGVVEGAAVGLVAVSNSAEV